MIYGCDGPWWRRRQGLPGYRGIKLAHDPAVCADYHDVHKIAIQDQPRLLFDEPGLIGSGGTAGGNSGFQALNIALQFGAVRVLLIGFDMHIGGGLHWYGRNTWHAANNPTVGNLLLWRDAFHAQVPVLKSRGIEVINASPDSALVGFEHRSVDDALASWGL